ncbi:putative glycosyltransferase Hoc1p [Trichomonascus vanleenenianus]|uniref:putative glycosyltransferase Hoc1p n=1 Tax=Trichomonascus vanleenenianus TaxID=2268995 RepID=UPI003ECA9DD8
MLTFRRALIVSVTALTLFLFFFKGTKTISKDMLLHDNHLEEQLIKTREQTEAALKELKQVSVDNAKEHQRKLELIEAERKLLDKQLQQLRRLPDDASIRTQLAFQFPYDVAKKFPAFIWQTWKRELDDPKFEEELKAPIASWKNKNPGFVHEVLSDHTAAALVRHLYMNVPKVIEAFDSMPESILKADFFRYLILLARGGTYSDVDTEALQPVPNWIPASVDPMKVGLIVGIEADPDRPDWKDWYARRIQFCQWTIQAKPGHPVLREIVARITDKTLKRKSEGNLQLPGTKDRGSQIMDWTGPGAWTDSVFAYLNDDVKSGLHTPVTFKSFTGIQEPKLMSDVLVLPITSFSPGVGTMGSQPETHPMAFVKHLFSGSWKPEDERNIGNE